MYLFRQKDNSYPKKDCINMNMMRKARIYFLQLHNSNEYKADEPILKIRRLKQPGEAGRGLTRNGDQLQRYPAARSAKEESYI